MEGKKKPFSKKGFIFACGLALAIGGLFGSKSNQVAQQALAVDAVSYMAWDGSSVKSVEGGCTDYTVLESNTTSWTDGGWYVFGSDTTINGLVDVTGTVNLILTDGYTLTINGGINVSEGNTLNIYGQTNGTGTLLCTKTLGNGAGIGGYMDETAGTVNIHGGNITANGGSMGGAGIGGGNDQGNGGTVTIYGGTVTATGNSGGAGIGGGNGGNAGTVTIYGGKVTAIATESYSEAGAGIGGGCTRSGGTVTILGGFVDARGTIYSAGIGHGAYASGDGTLIIADSLSLFNPNIVEKVDDDYARSVNMTVTTAATVTFNANGGTINSGDFDVYGEGIVTPLPTNVTKTDYSFGGWYTDSALTAGPVTEISADAKGNKEFWAKWKENIPYCAWDEDSQTVKAVPGGCSEYTIVESTTTNWTDGKWYVVNSDVTISSRVTVTGTANLILCDGATLTANGGISVNEGQTLNIYCQSLGTGALIASTANSEYPTHNSSIGGDYSDPAVGAGAINIHGGKIDASTSGDGYGAAIGGSYNASAGNITIYGGNVKAFSYYGAAIGGGAYYGGTDGNITIYGGNITVTSYHGAGIGGGDCASSGNIVINGGDITAQTNRGGAGIGGGDNGAAKTIIINNGSITAVSGYGAGIGGGDYGAGGDITINGGTIIARSGGYGAGIGSGRTKDGGNIVIKNGNITASGGNGAGDYTKSAAGIGGGYNGAGANVTIYDGYISASGRGDSVGIGAGLNNTNHGTLTIVDETKLSVYGSNSYNSFPPIEKVDGDYARFTYMRVKYPHEHIWSYVADGNIIRATCSAEDCYVSEEARTLTLEASDSTYDGTIKTANLVEGYSAEAFPSPTIKYYQGTTEVTSCVNVGTYTAKVTFDTATAEVEFTIAKATPTPAAVPDQNAVYGQSLSEITLPEGWAWNFPTDKVGNAGTNQHKATFTPTDTDNYNTVEQNVNVIVAKATPEYTVPTGLTTLVNKTLSTITLPAGWTWDDPTQNVGSEPGNKVFKGTFTPEDTTNYNIVEHVDITVQVTKHEHNWSYTASGATITASCSNPECPVTEGLTLTLQAPTGDMHYDGNAKVATLKAGYSLEAFPNATIKYFNNDKEVNECVNVGVYTAKVTFGNAVAMVEFEILGKTIVDPTQPSTVEMEIDDAVVPENVELRVEVRADVVEKDIAEDYAKIQAKLESNEQISKVYDVKLIQTVGGVEKEIQPSDIQPGLKITVRMAIPEGMDMNNVRILHIHSLNDMEFVSNYVIEGNELVFEIDRLSQFAFVTKVNAPAAGVNGGVNGGIIALIVIASILLTCCLFLLVLFIFFPRYYIDYTRKEVRRAILVRKHYYMVLLLNTRLQEVRRNENDVYKKKSDALNSLNK